MSTTELFGGFRLSRLEGARWMVRNGCSGRTFLIDVAEAISDARVLRILKRLMPKLAFLYETQRPGGEMLDVRMVPAPHATRAAAIARPCLYTTYMCMCRPGAGTAYLFHDDRLAGIRRAGWGRNPAREEGSLSSQIELRTLQVIFGMLTAWQCGDIYDV